MGNKESNESAAVKRQAEGFSNPMYRMLDLGVSFLDFYTNVCSVFKGGGAFQKSPWSH